MDVPTSQRAVLRCDCVVDLVCDEDGQVVERVDTDVWTTSTLSDTEVKDLDKIAGMIDSAIAAEYGAL